LSKGRIVLKFSGLDSIEQAEFLRDAEICVHEENVVELEDDEYYDWQLEGCDVNILSEGPLGKVSGVMRTGGTEILVVKGNEKDYLIPFAKAICVDVDVNAKRIVIDPPEGLLEF
jgi:16S rRNA processing protein RimM